MTIQFFTGENRFLSSFYPAILCYEEIMYPTAEHAYQAAKSGSREIKLIIAALHSPGQAKKYGREMKILPYWNDVKLIVMSRVVRVKFKHPALRQWLLDTGDEKLIEGNTWGDTYWGVCRGEGENHLGRIIMSIREEIQNAQR